MEPKKKDNEETKNKNRDAQKKRTSHKAVESVLRPEGSLWWERFVKKVILSGEILSWLSVWSEVQMICIWFS